MYDPKKVRCVVSFDEDKGSISLRLRTKLAVSAYSISCSRNTSTLLVFSATVPSMGNAVPDSLRILSAKSSNAFAP